MTAERIDQYFSILRKHDKDLYYKMLNYYNGKTDSFMPAFVRAVLEMAAYKDYEPVIAFATLAIYAVEEHARCLNRQMEEHLARTITSIDKF